MPWLKVVRRGFLWFAVVFCGFPSFFLVVKSGSPWFFVVRRGFLCRATTFFFVVARDLQARPYYFFSSGAGIFYENFIGKHRKTVRHMVFSIKNIVFLIKNMVFHVTIVRGLIFSRKNREFLYFSIAEQSPGTTAARHHEKILLAGLNI